MSIDTNTNTQKQKDQYKEERERIKREWKHKDMRTESDKGVK